MEARSAAIISCQPEIPNHNPADYLSFENIETQYPGCVTAGTLAVWACTHRYNFHLLVTKVGRNSRVRRDRWEKFLDSRTLGLTDELSCSCGIVGCQGPSGLQALSCSVSPEQLGRARKD